MEGDPIIVIAAMSSSVLFILSFAIIERGRTLVDE
jgi:hypothetical protein